MSKQAKQVRKVLKLVRRMNYWQRAEILDWLKDWYAYTKEEE